MSDDVDPDAPARADSLFDRWDEFRALFERRGVPPATIESLRHGFYVGAMAAFTLIVSRAQARDETAAEIAARLEALRVEIDGFSYDSGARARLTETCRGCADRQAVPTRGFVAAVEVPPFETGFPPAIQWGTRFFLLMRQFPTDGEYIETFCFLPTVEVDTRAPRREGPA